MVDYSTFEQENIKEYLRIKHLLELVIFEETINWFHMNEQYYFFHFRNISGEEIKKLQKLFKIHKIFGPDSTNTYELSIYLMRPEK